MVCTQGVVRLVSYRNTGTQKPKTNVDLLKITVDWL